MPNRKPRHALPASHDLPRAKPKAATKPAKPLLPLWEVHWYDDDLHECTTAVRAASREDALSYFWDRHPSAGVRAVGLLRPDAAEAGLAKNLFTNPREAPDPVHTAVDSLPLACQPPRRRSGG